MSKPLGPKFRMGELTTPIGVAVFPNLITPDTKFKTEGTLGTRLRLTPEQAAAIRPALEKHLADAEERYRTDGGLIGAKLKTLKVKGIPLTEELDRDTGEPTGMYILNSSRNATGTNKKTGESWEAKIIVKDSKGNPIPRKGLKIWSGSELRMNVTVFGWYGAKDNEVGIKLEPVAVQIRKLVSGGANDQFDSMDDGYIHEGSDDADDNNSQADGGQDDF